MQNAKVAQFGVSPAFFVSAHGEYFGPEHITASLGIIAELGFGSYQAEVFHREVLGEWTSVKAAGVRARGSDLGLATEVFVAHFLGHYLASEPALQAPSATEDFERVAEIAAEVGATTLAVPTLPVDTKAAIETWWPLFVERVDLMAMAARKLGLRFAVESVPGGLVGSSESFERLVGELEQEIWFVFDTGNIWAAGEDVPALAARLGSLIAATHISDAVDATHRSCVPGSGGVELAGTIDALVRSDYRGDLDVEINCSPTEVEVTYGRALHYLRRLAPVTEGDVEGAHHE